MSLLGDISGNFSLLTGGAYFSKDFRKCTSGPSLTQARKRICEAWPLTRPDGEERGGLRGSASYTALPCSEPPPNPPALGLGFDAWGHSRETRELAGAVGEGATPCTDGRPPENTPAWIASHQSSLPNAAKGYPPREPREPRGRKVTQGACVCVSE